MGSTNMDSTEYVGTYQIEFERPRKSTSDELLVTDTYEFFRGRKEECYRIASAFGGVGDDTRRTKQSCVIVGTAKHWDVLSEADEDAVGL
jgi:hypothetical protein